MSTGPSSDTSDWTRESILKRTKNDCTTVDHRLTQLDIGPLDKTCSTNSWLELLCSPMFGNWVEVIS